MRHRHCLAVTLGMMFLCGPAYAADYAPGSIGYLYNDCAVALENSATPGDFLDTYCGGFVEGYGMGVTVSNPPPLADPDVRDPCRDKKKTEFDRINARLCKNLPDYRDMKTPPGKILQTATDIVARWKNSMTAQKRLSVFSRPAIAEINSIITPGKFCDSLKVAGPGPGAGGSLAINPALLAANWYQFMQEKPVTLADKVAQCRKDLENPSFPGTRCAAEITGFIAGIYSTADLQKREPVKGACAKEIDRLYSSLDIPATTCVSQDTDPAEVAEVFIGSVQPGRQGAPGFGGAGYQAIYFGLMCRKP